MLQPLHGGLGGGHLTSPDAHRELDACLSCCNELPLHQQERQAVLGTKLFWTSFLGRCAIKATVPLHWCEGKLRGRRPPSCYQRRAKYGLARAFKTPAAGRAGCLPQVRLSKPCPNPGSVGISQKGDTNTTEPLTSSNDAAVISDADWTTSQASRLS